MTGRRLPPASNQPETAPGRTPKPGEMERIGRMRMERLGVLAPAASQQSFGLPPTVDVEPSAERRRQGKVERAKEQLPDAAGAIGSPFIALSTLAVMERNGTLTPRQRLAGDEFHRLFRLACLDGLKAAPLVRLAAPTKVEHHHGNEAARKRIAGAIRLLGGQTAPAASCAWHVLGLEWSLREWATKGLRCNADMARGVLVAALGALDAYFGGLTRPSDRIQS